MGKVLVQFYWSPWSYGRDKFNPGSFNVCIFESGLLEKMGILRKEKRSLRGSLWNAILLIPWAATFPPQPYWHLSFAVLEFIKPSAEDFPECWWTVGINLVGLRDPGWQCLQWKSVPCRGVSSWAGPHANTVVCFGTRRGAVSGPCEPEQTHEIWRRSREKESAGTQGNCSIYT